MSHEEIVAFLDNLGVGSTRQEKMFLDEYRSAGFKQDYLEDELFSNAVNGGIELESYSYTFDVDADPYLAEICPDGVSGHVSLLRFCACSSSTLANMARGATISDPIQNLKQAKEAFEEVRWMNQPG